MPSPEVTIGKKKKTQPQDHRAKSSFGKRQSYVVELPSGVEITLRRPGLQGLIAAGVLDSMDQLTSIVVSQTIPNAEGKPVVDTAAILADSAKVDEAMSIMNKIVVHVVAEPKLVEPYQVDDENEFILDEKGKRIFISEDDRDEDVAYVDYVEDMDRAFIMQFALGGSADLAKFREESKEALGSIPAIDSAQQPSE